MKTIAVLLGIVASVAALKMTTNAVIYLNNGRMESFGGMLVFTQDNPSADIEINGLIGKLSPAPYIIVVHDENSGTVQEKIGPPTLNYIARMNTTREGYLVFNEVSSTLTLELFEQNSIGGSMVLVYDNEAAINFIQGINNSLESAAYGVVDRVAIPVP